MSNLMAEKPRSNHIVDNIEGTCVYIPCHSTDEGTGTINAITKGSPTKIEFTAGGFTQLVGSYVYVADADTQMTGLVDGAYKVVKTDNDTDCYIDFDSTNETDWASGGTVKKYYFIDVFGNLAPAAIGGTVTTVFSTSDGITADTVGVGSSSAIITTGLEAFDLTGFRGRLFVGASIGYTAAGGSDGILATGKTASTGGDAAEGCVRFAFSTNQTQLTYRPEGAADGDCTNTGVSSGAIGTAKEYHAFILDFSDFPTAVEIYCINDGVLVAQSSATMTGATAEGNGHGLVLGANLSAAATKTAIAGTGSAGFQFGDIVWWKTTKSVADCLKVANDMATNFELSPRMAK